MHNEFNIELLPKQIPFILSQSRYTLYSGGFGSGKTYAGCLKAILYAWQNKQCFGLIGAQTYRQLSDTTRLTFLQILDTIEDTIGYSILHTFNKSENSIVLKNGAKILFRSFDEAGKLKSLNLDFWYMDEATEVSLQIWRMLQSRLRRGNHQMAWVTTNPDTFYHWVYTEIIKPYLQSDIRFNVIQTGSLENYFLGDEYIKDLKHFEKIDEDYYARNILGKWGVSPEGVVYKNFNTELHVREFEHTNFRKYFRAIDPGYTNPMCVLYIGVDGDDNFYVFDEIYESGLTDNEAIQRIKSKNNEIRYVQTYVDTENAAFRQSLTYNGIYNDGADKNVMAGIQSVMKKLILPNGNPGIIIHPRCKNLIMEILSYSWIKTPDGKPNREMPNKINDHAVDALRYFVHSYSKSFGVSVKNFVSGSV